ncbi:agmatinase [Caldicellulosiruptor morganii]|uniref:Agmatinase n=1 Tax=Caldicellulosiruptor morganii TaxID=1387555 RepID=A0ABY7BKB0_9FIRM|nr:agmatinase [Caldicellulosiruptor morganii]WAM32863.1 agmatinase [Caldicellulosiruptor morganii]
MNFKLYKSSFLCATEDYINSKVVLAGVPMDFTVSFKPGSRFGPSKIREVSVGLEEYSVYQNKNLFNKVFYDMGDLELPFGNVDRCINMIFEFGKKVFKDDKIPIFLGGEHLISFPLIKAAKETYDDLVVLHFDAHADMRDDYMGEKLSHATVMRRVGEEIGFKNLYQFGIRSGSEEEISFAKENGHVFFIYEIERFFEVLSELQNKSVYLSIDIDVVDPAFAPGTGTPEPGGLTSMQLIDIILKMEKLNIIGADIVEVSPYYDISDRTTLLAAKIIRELVLLVD